MDNGEERYSLSKRYSGNHRESYGSIPCPKIPHRDSPYSRPVSNQYVDEEDEYDDEEDERMGEEEDGNDQNNGFAHTSEEVDDGDDEDEFDTDEDNKKLDDVDMERHPKKRRLKNLVSSYELAPRMPAPSLATPAQKSFVGGRNSLTDWNERETVVLLDAWGERFLQHGRKSLRSEEWQEVAEKVSEVSKIDRTDTQCRNRLDTLKKKYKKEKSKSSAMGGSTSKWVYFKKIDMLMSSPPNQIVGLSCGLDSGEYVFMNPRAYLNRANGYDEMRDSPDNSESDDGDDDELDGLPPKKRMYGRNDDGSSFRMLADSIHKFSEIYEKIESSKRHQMIELEKMRMDFLRDLELQKRQIMESAQAEIARLRQGDDEEYGASARSASG